MAGSDDKPTRKISYLSQQVGQRKERRASGFIGESKREDWRFFACISRRRLRVDKIVRMQGEIHESKNGKKLMNVAVETRFATKFKILRVEAQVC